MSIQLTKKEAYAAMCEYLVAVYKRTQSDDLGGLLGDMSTIGEGETADPSVWFEWLNALTESSKVKVSQL